MEELFEVEESLSPYEQWKKTFNIHVYKSECGSWLANVKMGGFVIGLTFEGDSEEEAIELLCYDMIIPDFDEWRMKGGHNG
tara:strand:+ start:560 stop:802 length:243 start_codon:yes stop_codon:yes gene_type:complete